LKIDCGWEISLNISINISMQISELSNSDLAEGHFPESLQNRITFQIPPNERLRTLCNTTKQVFLLFVCLEVIPLVVSACTPEFHETVPFA
jgi:hypothetical protein